MDIEALPRELLSMIMQSMDSLSDLHTFIRASPVSFALFSATRETILPSVIKNALHPEAMWHALALLHAPTSPDHRLRDVESFVASYFSPPGFEFPTKFGEIMRLSRILARVSRFVDMYFEKCMDAIDAYDDKDSSYSLSPRELPLSIFERTRLQRAFLRLEIYSRICPASETYVTRGMKSRVNAAVQFERFVSHIEPWEVEEMTCVYEFFSSIMDDYLREMEDDFAAAVMAVPGFEVPENCDPYHEPRGWELSVKETETLEEEGEEMFTFSHLGFGRLFYLSRGSERDARYAGYAHFLSSLGFDFVHKMINANKTERTLLLRRYGWSSRDFLAEALNCQRESIADGSNKFTPYDPDEIDEEDCLGPNWGWNQLKPNEYEEYCTIWPKSRIYDSLREKGWVFWDKDRILSTKAHGALETASCLDDEKARQRATEGEEFVGYTLSRVEKRLWGTTIPLSQYQAIEDKFSPLYAEPDGSRRSRYT